MNIQAFLDAVSQGKLEIVKALIMSIPPQDFDLSIDYSTKYSGGSINNRGLTKKELIALQEYRAEKRADKNAPVITELHVIRDNISDIDLDVNTVNTALLLAAKQGHLEIIELLLQGGFDNPKCLILTGDKDHKQLQAAIKIANARYRKINYVKANPNIKDQNENTPLELAYEAGSLECIKLLLRFGAKIDKNKPSLLAYCKPLIIEVLKESKASRKDAQIRVLKKNYQSIFPELFEDLKVTPKKIAPKKLSTWETIKSIFQDIADFINYNIIHPVLSLFGIQSKTPQAGQDASKSTPTPPPQKASSAPTSTPDSTKVLNKDESHAADNSDTPNKSKQNKSKKNPR